MKPEQPDKPVPCCPTCHWKLLEGGWCCNSADDMGHKSKCSKGIIKQPEYRISFETMESMRKADDDIKRLREAMERILSARGLADAVIIADYALAGKDDRTDLELNGPAMERG